MAYRWKPSKSQKKAFAERMSDPGEQAAYYQRKEDKAAKRRSTSSFDYDSAGGEYVPTRAQYQFTTTYDGDCTMEQREAFNMIQYGFTCNEKVHHDFIHVVNELIRHNF